MGLKRNRAPEIPPETIFRDSSGRLVKFTPAAHGIPDGVDPRSVTHLNVDKLSDHIAPERLRAFAAPVIRQAETPAPAPHSDLELFRQVQASAQSPSTEISVPPKASKSVEPVQPPSDDAELRTIYDHLQKYPDLIPPPSSPNSWSAYVARKDPVTKLDGLKAAQVCWIELPEVPAGIEIAPSSSAATADIGMIDAHFLSVVRDEPVEAPPAPSGDDYGNRVVPLRRRIADYGEAES